MRVLTHAKVNLYLDVVGLRSDGYHEIRSVMQTVSLADEILLEETRAGVELTCDVPGVPLGEENMATRAFRRYQSETGRPKGIRLALVKRIPVAAGLGGGSGNAAGVLSALSRLHGAGADLHRMAADLGSDVPFFLEGGTQLAEGRGTDLTVLKPVPDCWMVLACADLRVSTAWAYGRLKMPLTREEDLFTMIQSGLSHGELSTVARGLFNRFEPVIFESHPELESLKREILRRGALGVVLSGSGPTLLVICDSKNTAAALDAWLATKGVHSFVVRPASKGIEVR